MEGAARGFAPPCQQPYKALAAASAAASDTKKSLVAARTSAGRSRMMCSMHAAIMRGSSGWARRYASLAMRSAVWLQGGTRT